MKSCCEHHRFNCNQGRQCPLKKVRSISKAKLKTAGFLTVLFLAYGLMGNMDYEDEVAAHTAAQPTQTAQGGQTE